MTALIGMDWGVSALRAWRIGSDGRVLDARRSASGVLGVAKSDFPAAFATAVGDWTAAYPTAPVLMCGMIGSRQGWVETPYAPAPAGLADLAGALTPAPTGGRSVAWIVPGVSLADGARREVMRGEETQIVGAAAAEPTLTILPGSHCKWAQVEGARIVDFSTFMTGELFAALKDHTILGRGLAAAPRDDEDSGLAFAAGVERGREGLAGALFQTRARLLIGELTEASAGAFLSGVVIGAEIEEGLARFGTPARAPALVGAPALVARYRAAFSLRAIATVTAGEETAAAGLFALARAAGLI